MPHVRQVLAMLDRESLTVPLFPLNTVLFPGGVLPLRIFEARYLDMVRRCMRDGSAFGIVLIRSGRETETPVSTHSIGTLAQIVDFDQLPDQLLGITTRGTQRFRTVGVHMQSDGLHMAQIETLPLDPILDVPPEFERHAKLLKQALPQMGDFFRHMRPRYDDAGWLSSRLAEVLPIPLEEKQKLLEMDDPIDRLHLLQPLIKGTAGN